MLTCRPVRSALSQSLDGELSTTDRWLVKLHLFICPRCRRVNASLRQTVSVLRLMGQQPGEDEPSGQ
jgi:predicted anti-sigma-YlaC factor YlaD